MAAFIVMFEVVGHVGVLHTTGTGISVEPLSREAWPVSGTRKREKRRNTVERKTKRVFIQKVWEVDKWFCERIYSGSEGRA